MTIRSGTMFTITNDNRVFLHKDFSHDAPVEVATVEKMAEIQAKYDMLVEEYEELKRRVDEDN